MVKEKQKKTTKEKFPYTDEQYENRDVFARFIKYFTPDTIFTVFVKNYFTDKTTNTCIWSLTPKEEIMNSTKMKTFKFYKVHFVNDKYEGLYVTLIRKYECTADKFYDKIKSKKDD